MIISHKHKFVFTRPMRVGSGTIQKAIVNSTILDKLDYHSGTEDSGFSKDFLKMNLPESLVENKNREGLLSIKGNLLHSTPRYLLEKGLLTEEHLETYNFLSIIRDPLERFLSCWLFEVVGLYFSGNAFEQFLEDIENKKIPNTYSFTNPKDYFYFEGKVIKNLSLLKTSTLEEDFNIWITPFKPSKILFNKSNVYNYPSWAKDGIFRCLPPRHLKLLKNLLREDLIFYKEFTGISNVN